MKLLLKLCELHTKSNGRVQLFMGGEPLPLSAPRLIKMHADFGLSIEDTLTAVETLLQKNCQSAQLDLLTLHAQERTISALLSEYTPNTATTCDVVLYGFGRIGRILARLLTDHAYLNLRAVVVRKPSDALADLHKRKSLLQRDSVHGAFLADVRIDESKNALIINGNTVQFIYANHPSEVNYSEYGISDALLIDNTGKYKDHEGLSGHLVSGIKKVLLTAPAKDVPNVVYGVNDGVLDDGDIFSAASCTTNAITPILKVLDDKYGIVDGHVETVHAYTNDQNLIDNQHKADRRGRAAALNMVITETGAAKAVAKALPQLEGRLTGNAIRVPTPNVSLAILNLNLNQSVNKDSLNAYIKSMAHGAFCAQIGYSDSPEAVSSDFIGTHQVGIFDAKATIADGARASLYVWYDNEMGYSTQVLRVGAKMMNAMPAAII